MTASFTHWGIYDISGSASGVAQNAGAADSKVGLQVFNDFATPGYGDPCPPANMAPLTHHGDTTLKLPPATADFPPFGADLYNALIEAAFNHHLHGAVSIDATYAVQRRVRDGLRAWRC